MSSDSNSSSCVAEEIYLQVLGKNRSVALIFDNLGDDGDATTTVVREVAPFVLIVVGLALSSFGSVFVRTAIAIAAFGAGALSALHAAYATFDLTWSCTAIIVSSVSTGVVAAAVSAALLRFLLVVVAAATTTGLTVLGLQLCGNACTSRRVWPGAPMLWNHSVVPFWSAIALAVVGGAVLARYKRTLVLALSTAVAGGFATATGVRIIYENQSSREMPMEIFVLAAFGVSAGGMLVQWWLILRKETTTTTTTSSPLA